MTVLTGAADALVVVDVQRDFCPGGSLGVPEGDQIIPVINRLIPMFRHWVYTRDWHPPNHVSFSAKPEYRDLSWPPHAMQGTPGAAWCPGLEVPADAIIVSHGYDPNKESYSGFEGKELDLAAFLRARGVDRLFVTGLATDYCVRQTALDGRAAGFGVFLIEDAVRGIAPETVAQALQDLEAVGVSRIRSEQIRDSGER